MLFRKIFVLSLFAFAFTCHSSAWADLSPSLLEKAQQAGGTSFDDDARSFTSAITFSLLQTQNRVKVSGPLRPFFEASYTATSVSDKRLYQYTTSQHSPASFQTIGGRVGTGLPFGFQFEAGFDQTVSEHPLTGVYASVGNQVMDLATLVYTDLVPAATVNVTFMRSLKKATLNAFAGTFTLGAYHRQTLLQLAYVFQYDYSMLGVGSDINNHFFRHGVTLHVPVWLGLYVRTEFFVPDMSGALTAGYQF